MLTIANLICGSVAIHAVVTDGDYTLAFGLIVLAALFDFCDGFAARLLKQSSPLGVELDSLADMVSFGVAPAMILSRMVAEGAASSECVVWSQWAEYIPYIIIAFSALRLAKFNIDPQQSEEFIGLPTPACALVCSSMGLIHSHQMAMDNRWVAVVAVVLATMLISPIRMFALKFKSFSLRDNSLRYGFLTVALLLLIVKPLYALPTIVALYIVISVIRHLAHQISIKN